MKWKLIKFNQKQNILQFRFRFFPKEKLLKHIKICIPVKISIRFSGFGNIFLLNPIEIKEVKLMRYNMPVSSDFLLMKKIVN